MVVSFVGYRVSATYLILLESKGNPKGNLGVWSTTQTDMVIACQGRGSHLTAVAFLSVAIAGQWKRSRAVTCLLPARKDVPVWLREGFLSVANAGQ